MANEQEQDDNEKRKVILLLLLLLLLLLGFWSFSIGETTPVSVDVDGEIGDNTPFTINVIDENGDVVANSTVENESDLPLTFGLTEGENYTLAVEGDYVLENNSEFTAGEGDVTVTLVEVDDSDDSDDTGDSKLVRV